MLFCWLAQLLIACNYQLSFCSKMYMAFTIFDLACCSKSQGFHVFYSMIQTLLVKSKKSSGKTKGLQNLTTEIFKTVHNLNQENARVLPNNIVVKSHILAWLHWVLKSGMHFQRKSNLTHHIKRLRSTLVNGLNPNVDVTYGNTFTIEYFIKLPPHLKIWVTEIYFLLYILALLDI